MPWWERKVTRMGYLFFGAPNERSVIKPLWTSASPYQKVS
nr:DUF6079 family protein [Desulfotomaculum nigrificans]